MRVRSKGNPTFLQSRPESQSCPICDEQRHAYLFIVHGLPIVRCYGCGLISLNPQPDFIDVDAYYSDKLGEQDPRLLWSDGRTERDAVRRYLLALKDRGVSGGPLLLIAPPD